MENVLFPPDKYGEHPDVCELYDIIEDLQKSSPASTVKVVGDEDIKNTSWKIASSGFPPYTYTDCQNRIIQAIEWYRKELNK